jgi:hypothetical protein
LSKSLRSACKRPMNRNIIAPVASSRSYFSMYDRLAETVRQPWRHVKAFIEPDGQNYESQLPDGYRLHGNTAANLSATVTHNALEMNQCTIWRPPCTRSSEPSTTLCLFSPLTHPGVLSSAWVLVLRTTRTLTRRCTTSCVRALSTVARSAVKPSSSSGLRTKPVS